MRILHTSDWHLGRQFHNVALLDDQAYVLDRIVSIACEREVDVVVVAGDVFDRSVPPSAATALLDDVLHRLAVEAGIPVIVTAGNHDGAERLGFGARAMERAGIHLRTRFDFSPVVLHDAHGPVGFFCLPYADPVVVADRLGEPVATHDEAMGALVARLGETAQAGARRVLVAHCFVAGGAARDSERPLSVGGADAVTAAHFAGYHYAALGHLHGAQSFAGGRVRYSGSILKYSFSEANDAKGVLLVDLDAAGEVAVEAVPLVPRHDLRILEGALDELLEAGRDDPAHDDYLLVRLTDTHAILDLMNKLREVYPNVLHVEREALRRAGERSRPVADHRRTGEMALVADFWRQVTGEDLGDDARELVAAALESVRRDEGD